MGYTHSACAQFSAKLMHVQSASAATSRRFAHKSNSMLLHEVRNAAMLGCFQKTSGKTHLEGLSGGLLDG